MSQNAPVEMQQALLEAVDQLPGVELWPDTPYSLQGAVGWVLVDSLRDGPENAYSLEGEFGHSHRPQDGSMHLRLPASLAQVVYDKRWGIPHPFSETLAGGTDANYLMVYGPRNEEELESVWVIVQLAYVFARGTDLTAITSTTWAHVKGMR